MQRRRAVILAAASGEVDRNTRRLDPNSGVGRLAYVVECVALNAAKPDASADGTGATESGFLADALAVGQAESTIALAVLAAIDLGWKPLLRHDRGDPLELVNRFLLVMRPWKVGEGDGSEGNYDFLLGNFVTIATRYAHLLSGEAKDHLVSNLLTQRGPIDFSQLTVRHGPLDVVSYGETENHILQIEIARYLTNQLVGFDNRSSSGAEPFLKLLGWGDTSGGVTSFLLHRLQGFLQNDFLEYNARPYQGHSVRALTALYDLADDPDVRTAAQLVLDYLAAKFAVSSTRLRRHVPFRRRREHTWDPSLLDDPESKRFVAATGMAHLFRSNDRDYDLEPLEPFTAVPAVLTTYRAPLVARDLIMTNRHKRYYQRFRHSGLELFYSTPAFLISAGGTRVGSALGSDWAHLPDIGVPVATTLIPSDSSVKTSDVIRILGNDTDEMKVNTGVGRGFACGLNSMIPSKYEPISDPPPERDGLAVVNATRLEPPQAFYFGISLKTEWARAAGEAVWLVAVPAVDMDFNQFRQNVLTGSGSTTVMDTTGLNRVNIDPIGPMAFTPAGDRGNLFRWPIRGADGQWHDCSGWPLAVGDVINSEDHSGVIHIDHPILSYMSNDDRRGLRIASIVSVKQELARREMDVRLGMRRILYELGKQGIRANGNLTRALGVLARRLTLHMRSVKHPVRITPRFTAREVALMLGRGLTADISVRRESARKRVELTRGLRAVLADLHGRGIHTDGSVTRAFEVLSGRPSPTGDVSLRACFNHHRLIGANDFRISTLLRGD